MDSPSLLDLFYLPEYLREALAEALVRGELMSYEVADTVSTVVFSLVVAAIYFGVVGIVAWGMYRRAHAEEALDRAAAGSHRAASVDAPWHKLVPNGFEADLCAWVVNDQGVARVFVATVLRLLRAGVMEIRRASLEDGLMEFVLRGDPDCADELGRAATDLIFPEGSRRVYLREVMDESVWTTEVVGDRIYRFAGLAESSCAKAGLIDPDDGRARERHNRFSVAFVLMGLVGAIWFSSAVPSPVTIVVFIASSVLLALSQRFIRTRALTPAGVLVVERLETLTTRLRAAADSGERMGDAGVSAAELIEYAVVVGLRAQELARLADASGSASLRRLVSEPLFNCEADGIGLSSKELASYRRRFGIVGGKTTRCGVIARIYGRRDEWYREQMSD